MRYKSIILSLVTLFAFTGCKDDGQVGSIIQPEEDLLHAHSSMVSLTSSSILADSTLSKADCFYLGEYTDPVFGTTKVEFMSQIDSRIDGLQFPNTTVVTSKSTITGILDSLLQSLDPKFGKIFSIDSATNVVVDSAFFEMNYGSTFFGDSTTLQAVRVYALSADLDKSKLFYTDTKVADYCNKDTLLGEISYQIQNSRQIRVPLPANYQKRLVSVYTDKKVTTQAQFDKLFKGIYVSHSFNGGGIISINSAGFHLFYHYDGLIKTTYDGRDTIINSANLTNANGDKISVLATDLFLSANKSVARINVVDHDGLTDLFPSLTNSQFTYIFAPAGIYTSVNIPVKLVKDSVKQNVSDARKVMFNSARLKVWAKNLDWKTDLAKKPYSYLLLLRKDSVVPFFAKNKIPDSETAFIAAYDTASCAYAFDITRAMQLELNGVTTIDGDMVVIPVNRNIGDMTYNSYVYTYSQVFSTSAAQFYNAEADEESKRPRIDFVYTERE